MRKLACALSNESVLLLGLVATVLTAMNVEKEWADVVQAAVPLVLAMVVRQVTSSPATVAEVAERAAVGTARALTEPIIGAAGLVTEEGQKLAETVARDVVKNVGGLVGVITEPEEKAA